MLRAQQKIKSACNQNSIGISLSKRDMGRLQSHLLNMYKDIEKVCIKYNLNMSLAFGNVLGVVRHGGWIPWDDDLDICMPREDYDKFLKVYASELPDNYITYALDNENGPIIRFGKVIDKNTVFSTSVDIYPPHVEGVFVDVFPYDSMTSKKFIHKFKKILAYGVMFIQNSVNQKKNASTDYKKTLNSTSAGKRIYYLRQLIGCLFNFISLEEWYRLLDRIIRNNKKSEYLYCGVSTKTGWTPMPRSYIFPAKKFRFKDGEEVFIPRDAEKYLTQVYGDWKVIPNDEDKWHHYIKDFKLPENEKSPQSEAYINDTEIKGSDNV